MRKWIYWISASAILMIGFPWLAVSFAGTNGMAICFLLFFAVNPLFSAVAGVFAGGNLRKCWPMPLVIAGLYLLGTWIFFEMGESAFLLYGGIYFVIGTLSMLVTALLKKYNERLWGRGKSIKL